MTALHLLAIYWPFAGRSLAVYRLVSAVIWPLFSGRMTTNASSAIATEKSSSPRKEFVNDVKIGGGFTEF
jgi:hypothetical protein